MGRTIKLLLYFFAYQLAFMGVAICGYMLYQGSYEVPQTPDSLYTNLIMLAQILSTAAVGIHLLVGKYVGLDQKTWGYHSSPKLLATSVVFIVAMGLWTNYFNELADLPNNMQEAFEMIMRNPLGIISVVIMEVVSGLFLSKDIVYQNGKPAYLVDLSKGFEWLFNIKISDCHQTPRSQHCNFTGIGSCRNGKTQYPSPTKIC